MRLDIAHHHLHQVSRRDALKFGAGAAAAAAAASTLADVVPADAEVAPADPGAETQHRGGGGGRRRRKYDDEIFDVDKVLAQGWGTSRYGPGDQRGTLNEITPRRTSRAMEMAGGKRVKAYQLGEEMFNGFPAFPSDPPRLHDMFLYVGGFEVSQQFKDAGGIQAFVDPLGPNQLTGCEERFNQNFTFQIATQLDGLNHVGTGQWYYNNNRLEDFISPTGTTVLGNETMGPIATRGVIIDIVGLKVAAGKTEDFFIADNGQPVLDDDYRITIDDIEHALYRQRIHRKIGPGDVPILHTGWTHLVRSDPDRYITREPGIYLAEARYFADRRVALIATDTWGLESTNPDVTGGYVFPCHQELFGKHGIRIGESFVTDACIADHVYEGLLVITPENVPGATCGSSAPTLLAGRGRKPRH